MVPIFNIEIFLASFSRSSHNRQKFQNAENLHILEEQIKKKRFVAKKTKFKMATEFKMTAKTKFAC
jgi:hemerythrin superfamily protein